MASLRNVAQYVLDDARDGIAWIALWKEGRSWGASSFYLEVDREGAVSLDDQDDLETLQSILDIDPHAIIVNSWEHNLGVCDGHVTRDDLAEFLRWQYELQNAALAYFIDRIVQPAQDYADDTARIAPTCMDEMHKNEENTEGEDLAAWGMKERTVTLTNDQWDLLVCYLLMTTKHREGERDAWLSLTQEKNSDGSPKFKNAAGNAAYWQDIIDYIEWVLPKLDGMGD